MIFQYWWLRISNIEWICPKTKRIFIHLRVAPTVFRWNDCPSPRVASWLICLCRSRVTISSNISPSPLISLSNTTKYEWLFLWQCFDEIQPFLPYTSRFWVNNSSDLALTVVIFSFGLRTFCLIHQIYENRQINQIFDHMIPNRSNQYQKIKTASPIDGPHNSSSSSTWLISVHFLSLLIGGVSLTNFNVFSSFLSRFFFCFFSFFRSDFLDFLLLLLDFFSLCFFACFILLIVDFNQCRFVYYVHNKVTLNAWAFQMSLCFGVFVRVYIHYAVVCGQFNVTNFITLEWYFVCVEWIQ